MKLKNTNLRRYDLYLHEESDARLIEHLGKFTASRRTNDELRRLLYLALDGAPVAARSTPAPMPAARPADRPAPDSPDDPPPGSKGAKLKKMFGMPG